MNYVSLALKFAPLVVIVALLLALAVMRGDKIKAESQAATATAAAAQLGEVNKANAETIKKQAEAATSNAAIATTLASALASNSRRDDTTRQNLQESYRNDPSSRSWADSALPLGVRDSLNRPPTAH